MTSYETVYLAADKERVARHVSERVPHLRQVRTDGAIEFRTNVGHHLATLSDATTDSGARGSRIRYRTSRIRPHLFHAHNKARQIRKAVEKFRAPDAR